MVGQRVSGPFAPEPFTRDQVLALLVAVGKARPEAVLGFARFPLVQIQEGSRQREENFAELYAELLHA